MDQEVVKELIKSQLRADSVHSVVSATATSPSSSEEELETHSLTNNSVDVGVPGNGNVVRGRSVRDIEDQLTSLKKENFNLKLRIYFLEERMGTNFNLDKESAVKKNVELMVEVETLRKELQEKQDLLCQAVKAMELEEEEHKKETKQKEQQITEYQEQIDELLAKIQDLKTDYNYSNKLQQGDSEITNFLYPHNLLPEANNGLDIVKELQTKIEELQCELAKEKDNSAALENLLQIADCASIRCKSLEEESLQKDKKINELHKEIHEFAKKVSSSNLRIQSLEDELSQTNSELQYKTHELQTVQHELKSHVVEIEQLKKLLSQTQLMYESEQRKGEKLKAAVMARNSKVIELENLGETQKAKIRNLETRLESAQNEVKRKTDELAAIKSPVRRQQTPNTDDNSFSVQDNTPEVSGSPNDKKNNQKVLVKTHSPSVSSSLRSPAVSSSRSPVKKTPKNGEISQPPDIKILVEENQKQKEDITAQQQKILKLKSEQFKACQIIKSMINTRGENEKEIEYLRKRVEELEEQICSIKEEKEKSLGSKKESGISLKSKLSEMKFTAITNPAAENEKTMAGESGHLTEHYKKHINDLEKQIATLLETVKEKDVQIKRLITQMHEISKNLKSKDNMIVDLEFELLTANHGVANTTISSQTECQEGERSNTAWLAEIENKDKAIERLESELRKRTCDLQGIVNKELWEKNREIEKLQNRYENIVLAKEQEIANLEEVISGKDLQLKLLKDEIKELGNQINLEDSSIVKPESGISDETKTVQERIAALLEERKRLLQQIDELKKKLQNLPDHNTNKLEGEYKELREELEKSEKLRFETSEVCMILSARLEELAHFLNSLLKQKLVLGLLGSEQNTKLQEIVDQSLDLSHTLNTTLMLNPDQSLIQLSNISELLDISKRQSLNVSEFFKDDQKSNEVLSIIPANATLTYQNHLTRPNCDEKQDITKDEVIKVLREQVEDLKHEIEIRDLEFDQITSNNLPKKSEFTAPNKNTHENASESESWSEPDRFVSMARIGLNDGILKPPSANRNKPYDSDSTESEASNEFTYTPKKHSTSENNHQTILILHKQVIELEAKLRDKDKQILSEQLACIEIQRQLKMSEEKIKSCENSLREAEEKVVQLNKVINELQQLQRTLEEKLNYKDKVAQNKINMLEAEKDQAIKAVKIAEEIAENAKISLHNAEQQISILESQIERNEEEALTRFQAAQIEFEEKIEQIEQNAETQIKKIKESVEQMEIVYKRDYIKRSEIDKRIGNIDEVANELENYKTLLKAADDKVRSMEERERDLKQNLQIIEKEYQDKVNNIRKDLDSATLQYSETVLEKTKIASEKASLEQQLKKLDSRDGELLKQVSDIHDEFTSVKQAFQMQVANLENQKSKLEMKVSELESKNAELVNRLIKLQTGHGDNMHLSTSVPASPNRYYELYGNSNALFQMPEYRRQFSDNSRYVYMSDNAGDDHNRSEPSDFGIMQLLKSPVDHERNQSNSSPDLGIESDHGRFSSLEANVYVPRSLQATLALTESMNNLLDGDNNTCNNDQCCQKVKQMASENAELKKRLLRTRRALEETITQLSLANQRKKQVERTICKQIHKTSQVLRKAKANLDSGSESDVLKKNEDFAS